MCALKTLLIVHILLLIVFFKLIKLKSRYYSSPYPPTKRYLLLSVTMWKRKRNHIAFIAFLYYFLIIDIQCPSNPWGRYCHAITAFSLKPQDCHLLPTRMQTYWITFLFPLFLALILSVSNTFGILWYYGFLAWDHIALYFHTSFSSESLQPGLTYDTASSGAPHQLLSPPYQPPLSLLHTHRISFLPFLGSLVLDLPHFIESTSTFMTSFDVALPDFCD